MKILIIAYYYPPLHTGGTPRPHLWAKHLAKLGHDVSVLTQTYTRTTAEPGNPRVIRIRDISCNKDKTGIRKKIRWLLLRGVTEVLNILGIYHSIYSWWKHNVIRHSEHIIRLTQPDIIIATYPPVETLEIGTYLGRIYGIPLITDFRDGLMFEPIESKRMSQYRCIRNTYREIEQHTAAQAAAITAVSTPITEYYRETYRPPYTELIFNAFDPEDLKDLPTGIQLEADAFNIVFTGRFSLSDQYHQAGFFFTAVRLLIAKEKQLERKIKIHLVGEYRREELAGLEDLLLKGIIERHGFVERRTALAFQRAADLLLIISRVDRPSFASAKIFEYLFSGKPILALAHNNTLENIIKETKTGWIVHPQQPEAIAELLEKIITDKEFYHALQPERETIENYSIAAQIKTLNALLAKIENREKPAF